MFEPREEAFVEKTTGAAGGKDEMADTSEDEKVGPVDVKVVDTSAPEDFHVVIPEEELVTISVLLTIISIAMSLLICIVSESPSFAQDVI